MRACASRALLTATVVAALAVSTGGQPSGNAEAGTDGNSPESWQFVVTPYGWGPSVSGRVGVDGHSAEFDLPIDKSINYLTAGGMLGLEARKGRWGLLFDGTYMQLEDDAQTPGEFFTHVDVTYKQATLDLGAFYRIWQSERGWVDLLAGARYMYYSTELDFDPNYAAADDLSAQVVDRAAGAVRGAVEDRAGQRADDIADELSSRVGDTVGELADAARKRIREQVGARIDTGRLQAILLSAGDRLAQGVDGRRADGDGQTRRTLADTAQSAFANRIDNKLRNRAAGISIDAEAGLLASAIRDAVADRVRSRIQDAGSGIEGNPGAIRDAVRDAIREAARDSIDDLKATASAEVRKALDGAEKKLTQQITAGMEAADNADVSEETEWVDAYVGARARWLVTDRLYAGLRGDVGGFGIGASSDLVWELFGGVGYEFNETMAMELGWRYLDMDRTKGGAKLDMTYSGATAGLAIKL